MERVHIDGDTKLVVTATLRQLKGNNRPYFSITANYYEGGRSVAGGCMHDEILATWPDLAPLVALHLSDDDGSPMHAAENAWYHAGGTHWNGANIAALASHLRVSRDVANSMIGMERKEFDAAVNAMRPRWKTEADAAINQFSLTVTKE